MVILIDEYMIGSGNKQIIAPGSQTCHIDDVIRCPVIFKALAGGGPDMQKNGRSYPTVIEGTISDNQLKITVHNIRDEKIQEVLTFAPRKVKKNKKKSKK